MRTVSYNVCKPVRETVLKECRYTTCRPVQLDVLPDGLPRPATSRSPRRPSKEVCETIKRPPKTVCKPVCREVDREGHRSRSTSRARRSARTVASTSAPAPTSPRPVKCKRNGHRERLRDGLRDANRSRKSCPVHDLQAGAVYGQQAGPGHDLTRWSTEQHVKQVPVTTCRMVSEVMTKQVPETICEIVTSENVKQVPVTTCRMVNETAYKTVAVHRPASMEPRTCTRQVPVSPHQDGRPKTDVPPGTLHRDPHGEGNGRRSRSPTQVCRMVKETAVKQVPCHESAGSIQARRPPSSVPYTVCRTVCETMTKQVPVTICRTICEVDDQARSRSRPAGWSPTPASSGWPRPSARW